ncbi:MAG: uL15 family ribosomal protein [Candidatus Woesebacteria bacterium]|nr:uL15 family ribosomal protein [Candidatus Woesebacteria bacterium]
MTNLPKVVENRKKRVGRGYGSGKGGHTVGRGQKGQKSRTKIGVLFEGVKVKKSLLKRLPFQRGKGKNKGGKGPVIVNVEALNILPAGSKVTIETLIKARIVDEKDARAYGVKILGNGKLEKKLIIEVPASKSVLKFLEKSAKV